MFHSYFEKYDLNSGIAVPKRNLWSIASKKSLPQPKLPTASENYTARVTEECQHILDALQKTYTCTLCDAKYIGMSNIGSWRCKAHVGMLDSQGKWDCCGQKTTSIGCKRADHISQRKRMLGNDIYLEIPLWIANQFNIPPERFTVVKHSDPRLMKVVVRRVEI